MCAIRRRPDRSAHCCCEIAFRGSSRGTMTTRILDDNARLGAFARRFVGITRWLFPSATLVLLPKCPACFAAYVAMATGLGLSMSTATYLRMLLVILCVTSLSYLTARLLRRFIARKHPLLPRRNDQPRIVRIPLIAEPERQRLWRARGIIMGQIWLVEIFEQINWSRVGTKEPHSPSFGSKVAERNAGVILQDRRANS